MLAGSRFPVGSSQSKSLRVVDERAGDRGALLLAAGEFAGIHAALVGEPDEIERARNLAHDVARGRAGHLHRERDVLPNRLVGEQFEILEHDAQLAAQRRNARTLQRIHADAVDRDLARRRLGFAIEKAKETRFSGSRMSDEKDEIALPDLQTHVVEGVYSVGIHERDAAQRDHCLRKGFFRRASAYTFGL